EQGSDEELTVQSLSAARTADIYRRPPIVVAIDGSSKAAPVMDAVIELARLLDTSVEVLHVLETDITEELAVDRETPAAAREISAKSLDRLRAVGIDGAGHLLRVVSGHGDAGRRIAAFASEHHAGMIV